MGAAEERDRHEIAHLVDILLVIGVLVDLSGLEVVVDLLQFYRVQGPAVGAQVRLLGVEPAAGT